MDRFSYCHLIIPFPCVKSTVQCKKKQHIDKFKMDGISFSLIKSIFSKKNGGILYAKSAVVLLTSLITKQKKENKE